tara:strand:+ start:2714 stop:3028 length:315 start_codon:yes stop_codon:yes gene_type:complete
VINTPKKKWRRPKPILVLAGNVNLFRGYCHERSSAETAEDKLHTPLVYGWDEMHTRGMLYSGVVLTDGYRRNPIYKARDTVLLAVMIDGQRQLRTLAQLIAADA